MRTQRVSSSVVVAVGYDAPRRILEVTFRNGRTYYYVNVPPAVYRSFMSAESIGTFLNEVIKPKYRAFRMRAGKLEQVR
ncbi:MAG TPA: KTSC domain-containing protein [Thermoanaerobaculia bacterium]|jgi:hypothetical protein|nr:KTSC domain-containing protein [Thermoanaerobaculia bacterium]